MRRETLIAALEELGALTGESAFIVLGSQSVHAFTDDPPVLTITSDDADIALLDRDFDERQCKVIAVALGEESEWSARVGAFVEPLSLSLPTLPPGWEERARALEGTTVQAFCVDPHDLAVAKLVAARLKDGEFIEVCVGRGLMNPSTIREHIRLLEDERLEALLLQRLDLALRSEPLSQAEKKKDVRLEAARALLAKRSGPRPQV